MPRKSYYSTRTGRNPAASRLDLPVFKRLFLSLYNELVDGEWFQEALGYRCIDDGDVPGTLGKDVEARVLLALRKTGLWPLTSNISRYSEDDLFDMIEFLHDVVSQPVDGEYHSFGNCGMHYHTFDRSSGQKHYREKVNELLREYGQGFELSEAGEILALPDDGMQPLLEASIPASADPTNVRRRVEDACNKFRRRGASLSDRRDALRDLADVLEYLRPQVKRVLRSKDEGDLFSLANNFGIRHHNLNQQTDYDQAIWYSWMFYYFLASIHAALRMLERAES